MYTALKKRFGSSPDCTHRMGKQERMAFMVKRYRKMGKSVPKGKLQNFDRNGKFANLLPKRFFGRVRLFFNYVRQEHSKTIAGAILLALSMASFSFISLAGKAALTRAIATWAMSNPGQTLSATKQTFDRLERLIRDDKVELLSA